MIKPHRTPKGSRRGGGNPKRQSDKVLDKVKDLKECQEKHDFLKMLTMADFENGDSLDVIDKYIDRLDRELDDLMDADYSILPTEDTSRWVACDACTFVMTSVDELKKHVANFHPKVKSNITTRVCFTGNSF